MTKIMAAGILPISINEKGDIVFLLGQESPNESCVDQLTWCSFGGGIDPGETIEKCASREFDEESMALFANKEDIYNIIISKKYPLITWYSNDRYMEYVVYFDYKPEWPDQFSRVYNYFHRCAIKKYGNSLSIPSCPNGYSEKINVRWFTIEQILENSVKIRPCFFEIFKRVVDHIYEEML